MKLLNSLIAAASIGLAPASIKFASSSNSTFSIETSTVQQDLYCFYKDQYPKNTLSYLVPHKENGDQYDDFKLLTMYANQGDLYLYFYVDLPYEFTSVKFEYSTSTTLNEDNTEIIEDYQTGQDAFNCRIHDVNGTNKRFYKVVCDDFYEYEVGSKHRVKAFKIIGELNNSSTMIRECNDSEYSWEDQREGVDQIYTYYHNNYIILNNNSAVLQFIPTKFEAVAQTDAIQYKEVFWLFFDYDYTSLGTNYSLGNLVEATVSYEFLTYDVSYRVDGAIYENVYGGLYENPDEFFKTYGHNSREAKFYNLESVREESTVKPSSKRIKTNTSSVTLFFFWNITKSIDYSYNTIQALDDESIDKIKDENFKSFIEANRGSYKYAIDFRESYRNRIATSSDNSNLWDAIVNTRKVESKCHEATDIAIVKLAFQNQDGIAELNALMNPVDSDFAITTSPNTYTTMSLFGTDVSTIGKNLIIIIGAIAAVVLVGGIIYLIVKNNKKKKSSNNTNISIHYPNHYNSSKKTRKTKK